jgi:hypothetical protein
MVTDRDHKHVKMGALQHQRIGGGFGRVDGDVRVSSVHPKIAQSEMNLQPHQMRAVLSILKRPKFALLHPPGAGKTLTAIVSIECLLADHPNTALYERWKQDRSRYRHREDVPPAPKRPVVVGLFPAGLITNFLQGVDKYGRKDLNSIQRDYRLFSFEHAASPKHFPQLLELCKDAILVVDEVQTLRTAVQKTRDAGAKRTRASKTGLTLHAAKSAVELDLNPSDCTSGKKAAALLALRKVARHVILLSGSSLVNKVGDIHTVARILAPNEAEFLQVFPTSKSMDGKFTEDQHRALNAALIGNLSYITPAELDRSQFPTVTEHLVVLEMDPDYAAEYTRIEKGELKKTKDGTGVDIKRMIDGGRSASKIDAAGCFYNGLRRASNTMGPLCDSRKRAFLMNKAREIANKRQSMTIASNYREYGIHSLVTELKELKIQFDEVSGEIKKDDRTLVVKAYNAGKLDVLLLTLGAGGVGLDLKGTRMHCNFEPVIIAHLCRFCWLIMVI